ncbi:hypothetical protein GPECTOR_50g661 [Gonium pectorale]|uniref:Ubiquitin-like protease family profile domain-containing protein n=1 Tax=Gonium pectorale TaxID=33097 RepID=A0A150G7P4_GONPE|nr:hypothetical protein GPECTOR_50g661 [Gonium pectorale]|eukprot:KXZ45867.1 hypothetical protein GPECTOR_50g661 [Gonium pectorale]
MKGVFLCGGCFRAQDQVSFQELINLADSSDDEVVATGGPNGQAAAGDAAGAGPGPSSLAAAAAAATAGGVSTRRTARGTAGAAGAGAGGATPVGSSLWSSLASKLAGLKCCFPPAGGKHSVEIVAEDLARLDKGEFLNDTCIDFYIKYIEHQLPEEVRSRYHFFNSFFMKKLMEKLPEKRAREERERARGMGAPLPTKAARNHERVKKWTKHVDLFSKDYIFLPVHDHLHWSLLLICHPGNMVANERYMLPGDTFDPELAAPCMLHLDSLEGSHTAAQYFTALRSYLAQEWVRKAEDESQDTVPRRWRQRVEAQGLERADPTFELKLMPGLRLTERLPMQDNHTDCGLFLLAYVDFFTAGNPERVVMQGSNARDVTAVAPKPEGADALTFMQKTWFTKANTARLRDHLRCLILELLLGRMAPEDARRGTVENVINEYKERPARPGERYLPPPEYLAYTKAHPGEPEIVRDDDVLSSDSDVDVVDGGIGEEDPKDALVAQRDDPPRGVMTRRAVKEAGDFPESLEVAAGIQPQRSKRRKGPAVGAAGGGRPVVDLSSPDRTQPADAAGPAGESPGGEAAAGGACGPSGPACDLPESSDEAEPVEKVREELEDGAADGRPDGPPDGDPDVEMVDAEEPEGQPAAGPGVQGDDADDDVDMATLGDGEGPPSKRSKSAEDEGEDEAAHDHHQLDGARAAEAAAAGVESMDVDGGGAVPGPSGRGEPLPAAEPASGVASGRTCAPGGAPRDSDSDNKWQRRNGEPGARDLHTARPGGLGRGAHRGSQHAGGRPGRQRPAQEQREDVDSAIKGALADAAAGHLPSPRQAGLPAAGAFGAGRGFLAAEEGGACGDEGEEDDRYNYKYDAAGRGTSGGSGRAVGWQAAATATGQRHGHQAGQGGPGGGPVMDLGGLPGPQHGAVLSQSSTGPAAANGDGGATVSYGGRIKGEVRRKQQQLAGKGAEESPQPGAGEDDKAAPEREQQHAPGPDTQVSDLDLLLTSTQYTDAGAAGCGLSYGGAGTAGRSSPLPGASPKGGFGSGGGAGRDEPLDGDQHRDGSGLGLGPGQGLRPAGDELLGAGSAAVVAAIGEYGYGDQHGGPSPALAEAARRQSHQRGAPDAAGGGQVQGGADDTQFISDDYDEEEEHGAPGAEADEAIYVHDSDDFDEDGDTSGAGRESSDDDQITGPRRRTSTLQPRQQPGALQAPPEGSRRGRPPHHTGAAGKRGAGAEEGAARKRPRSASQQGGRARRGRGGSSQVTGATTPAAGSPQRGRHRSSGSARSRRKPEGLEPGQQTLKFQPAATTRKSAG